MSGPIMYMPAVVELLKEWAFDIQVDMASGTRAFIAAAPGSIGIPLPMIGDSWDANWPRVTLKNISERRLADNPNCPIIYTAHYDSQPLAYVDQPLNLDINSEFITYPNIVTVVNPGSGTETTMPTWKWADNPNDAGAKDMEVPIQEVGMTVTFPRFVFGTSNTYTPLLAANASSGGGDEAPLVAFLLKVQELAGCINSTALGGGMYAVDSLLFMGAKMTEISSPTGVKMWRTDLTFKWRCVQNPVGCGDQGPLTWQYIFDPTNGYWRMPVRSSDSGATYTTLLFVEKDFSPLFTLATASQSAGPTLPVQ